MVIVPAGSVGVPPDSDATPLTIETVTPGPKPPATRYPLPTIPSATELRLDVHGHYRIIPIRRVHDAIERHSSDHDSAQRRRSHRAGIDARGGCHERHERHSGAHLPSHCDRAAGSDHG